MARRVGIAARWGGVTAAVVLPVQLAVGAEAALSPGEPAAWLCANGPSDPADRGLARLVARAGGEWDSALARAARAAARWLADRGEPPAAATLDFLGSWAGVCAAPIEPSFHDSVPSDAELLARLRRAIGDDRRRPAAGAARVGVGEARGRGGGRTVVVLVTRSPLRLEPVARRVEPGATVALTGRLAGVPGLPSGLVLSSDGAISELAVRPSGAGFVAELEVGGAVGEALVELSTGDDPVGRLTLAVGRPPAASLTVDGQQPGSDSGNPLGFVAGLIERINRDRRRAGAAPLVPEDALARIALAHAEEMRERQWVGHDGRRGGTAARLRQAGYRAVAIGENVARGASPGEVHDALMRSLGHRRNLLDPRFTRVGVAALPAPGEGGEWYVAQIFARPVPLVDAAEGAAFVRLAIDQARGRRGLAPLGRDPALEEVARREACRPEPTPRHALEQAQSLLGGTLWAAVEVLGELDDLRVPDELLEPTSDRLGVGVAQDPAREPPNLVVVLLAAR